MPRQTAGVTPFLAAGTVYIQAGEDRIKATVGRGFLQILNNAVTLLADGRGNSRRGLNPAGVAASGGT